MLAADALSQVKGYLDIEATDTTFDASINGFVGSGVKRLYPLAQNEIDEQSASIVVVHGRATIDMSALSTPLAGVRFVEVGDYRHPVETLAHSSNLILTDVPSSETTAYLFGLARYTLATIPDELELAIVYFAASEFFKFLIGNKRKYNVYMTNGRAAVENMQELVDYYEGLANQHLADRITLYGAY